MSYRKATEFLPEDVLELIQKYVEGECIYIPKRRESKKSWGSNTSTKDQIKSRNLSIYTDFLSGIDKGTLSKQYYLSLKSIERIILKEKKKYL